MSLNVANINTMIDTFIRLDKAPLLERPDKGFNMSRVGFEYRLSDYSGHSCGTASCIEGWSDLIFKSSNTVVQILEVRNLRYRQLTMPKQVNGCMYHYRDEPEKFTLRAAIRVLQILRDTGKVDWNEAIANPWTPESEDKLKADAWSTDGWLANILGQEDTMAVEGLIVTEKRRA